MDKKRGGAPTCCRRAPRGKEVPASPYSPAGGPCSTLGNAALNFRVRNGNGCGLRFMETGEKVAAHGPGAIGGGKGGAPARPPEAARPDGALVRVG